VVPAQICQGPGVGRPIHELTLAELKKIECGTLRHPNYPTQQAAPGTRIPTLDEVFSLAPRGRFDFNIETKIFASKPELTPPPQRFVELVLAEIRKHRLEERVILQSFDFRTLRAMKKLEPRIRLSALDETGGRSFPEVAREAGAGIVSPHFRLVTPEGVAAAHAAGLQVVPWTANEPAQWEKLAAAKVDGIISDDPARLIEWLKARKLR
jgi:glycerophosphoryl diester phosphodiesterase